MRLGLLLSVVVMGTVIWASQVYLTRAFSEGQEPDATLRATLYAGSIQSAMQRHSVVPLLLARDPILMIALRSGQDEEAEARLQQARSVPRTSPAGERLACIVGAAGFAYLFGGKPLDAAVATVAGLLEILICQWFGQHKINRIFTDIVAAFACTVWSVGVQAALPAVSANAAIIGALMVLTPGVALTMGVRDILNGDYLSGSIRLLDAVLIAGSIACGVVLGWLVMHGLGVAV